ncbi:hypothetical protein V8B97DRAFT_1920845 [Scleroderma yunnanense]
MVEPEVSTSWRGHPPPTIVTENFQQIGKVNNKSNCWYYECIHCSTSEGTGPHIKSHDNNPIQHLTNPANCPNVPAAVHNAAQTYLATKSAEVALPNSASVLDSVAMDTGVEGTLESTSHTAGQKPSTGKHSQDSLLGYVNYSPLTKAQHEHMNVKLFCPASCYVLSHSIMASEECWIQLEDIERLKDRKQLIFLIDGWEDKLKQSLYGATAAEVHQFPVVLSLTNLMGHCASADKILEAAVQAFQTMELEDGCNFIALTTDNPMVMQAFWRKFQDKYYWIIALSVNEDRIMFSLSLEDGDHAGFWAHAHSVFNCHFHTMNTNIHLLTLFLHPLCQKLAISQVANGCSFQFMVEAALKIAKQWRWSEALTLSVVHDLKKYYKCSGVFVGGEANALGWWESLPISAEKCPLKIMAITIHFIVSHAADVKSDSSDPDDHLAGPELITDKELVQAFEELKHKSAEALRTVDIDQPEDGSLPTRILDGNLYAWDELDQVDKGLVPRGFREEVTALETASLEGTSWDVSLLMLLEGL